MTIEELYALMDAAIADHDDIIEFQLGYDAYKLFSWGRPRSGTYLKYKDIPVRTPFVQAGFSVVAQHGDKNVSDS